MIGRFAEGNQAANMIIPTPEFDPMFADDGVPFRAKMVDYIEREFADILTPHLYLLQNDGDLDELVSRIAAQPADSRSAKAA